jgi:hypothetical protein
MVFLLAEVGDMGSLSGLIMALPSEAAEMPEVLCTSGHDGIWPRYRIQLPVGFVSRGFAEVSESSLPRADGGYGNCQSARSENVFEIGKEAEGAGIFALPGFPLGRFQIQEG